MEMKPYIRALKNFNQQARRRSKKEHGKLVSLDQLMSEERVREWAEKRS